MSDATDLSEARAALHKLVTGKQVASFSVAGRTVTYTPATRHELEAYIADLEKRTGSSTSSGYKRRPFGVAF